MDRHAVNNRRKACEIDCSGRNLGSREESLADRIVSYEGVTFVVVFDLTIIPEKVATAAHHIKIGHALCTFNAVNDDLSS